jgi:hypothetical protein
MRVSIDCPRYKEDRLLKTLYAIRDFFRFELRTTLSWLSFRLEVWNDRIYDKGKYCKYCNQHVHFPHWHEKPIITCKKGK